MIIFYPNAKRTKKKIVEEKGKKISVPVEPVAQIRWAYSQIASYVSVLMLMPNDGGHLLVSDGLR